jgi:hypothetical protein
LNFSSSTQNPPSKNGHFLKGDSFPASRVIKRRNSGKIGRKIKAEYIGAKSNKAQFGCQVFFRAPPGAKTEKNDFRGPDLSRILAKNAAA